MGRFYRAVCRFGPCHQLDSGRSAIQKLGLHRAGGRIVGFHVSDWPVPLPAILMGRAMMGDGVIDLRKLRQAVDATGYGGPIEVEIFNDEIWESADDGLLKLIQRRFIEHV